MTLYMEQELEKIGLKANEIAVYLALLELGQANILELSRKALVPRATVYNILDVLTQKNMVSSVEKGKRQVYFAEDPKIILKKTQEKERAIREILPQIMALYLASTPRPVIRTYDGRDGILDMFEDILRTVPQGGNYDVILNSEAEIKLLGKDYYRHIERRKNRGISIRIVSERSEYTQNWNRVSQDDLREVKFIPKGQHFSVSYHIYANKVAMFSLQGPVVGVIIENKEIADMERLQFEYMWKGLK